MCRSSVLHPSGLRLIGTKCKRPSHRIATLPILLQFYLHPTSRAVLSRSHVPLITARTGAPVYHAVPTQKQRGTTDGGKSKDTLRNMLRKKPRWTGKGTNEWIGIFYIWWNIYWLLYRIRIWFFVYLVTNFYSGKFNDELFLLFLVFGWINNIRKQERE